MPRDVQGVDERELTRMAWMYYIQGMTHAEIADRLHFSRPKVTRMLLKAKEMGIVNISINGAYSICVELEEKLKAKTNVKKVIVVPAGNTEEESSMSVGRATADYLNSSLVKGDVLGVAWGISFLNIWPYLKDHSELKIKTVQLMGGITGADKMDPQFLMGEISRKLGAEAMMKPVPVMVGSADIKRSLLKDDGIKAMMDQAKSCSKALIGVGGVTPETCSLCKLGIIDDAELEKVKCEDKAKGDIIGWFVDSNGVPVETSFADRMMSTDIYDLKNIPEIIVETSGVGKLEPLKAAIRGGFVDTMIIDEELATALAETY